MSRARFSVTSCHTPRIDDGLNVRHCFAVTMPALITSLQDSLRQAYGGEYNDQLGAAMRQELGSSRNEGNIDALKKRLEAGSR